MTPKLSPFFFVNGGGRINITLSGCLCWHARSLACPFCFYEKSLSKVRAYCAPVRRGALNPKIVDGGAVLNPLILICIRYGVL